MLTATAITTRLAEIGATLTAANGYTTNIGANTSVAQHQGMARHAPALYITPGRQRVTKRYARIDIEREIAIKAFIDLRQHPGVDEYELVDRVIWDLRKGFGTYDAGLMAFADRLRIDDDQPGYSEDGGSICGAAITLAITYTVDPDDPTT